MTTTPRLPWTQRIDDNGTLDSRPDLQRGSFADRIFAEQAFVAIGPPIVADDVLIPPKQGSLHPNVRKKVSVAKQDAYQTARKEREAANATKRPLTPEVVSSNGTEHGHQVAVFLWASQQTERDLSLMHAIPNGGSRGDDYRSRMIRGAKFKSEGVKSGVPDIFLPIPSHRNAAGMARTIAQLGKPVINDTLHGLYIELKRPALAGKRQRAGKTSGAQDTMADKLRRNGYAVATCYGWKSAVASILDYLGGCFVKNEYALDG